MSLSGGTLPHVILRLPGSPMSLLVGFNKLVQRRRLPMSVVVRFVPQRGLQRLLPDGFAFHQVQVALGNSAEADGGHICPWFVLVGPVPMLRVPADNVLRLTDVTLTVGELKDVNAAATSGCEQWGDSCGVGQLPPLEGPSVHGSPSPGHAAAKIPATKPTTMVITARIIPTQISHSRPSIATPRTAKTTHRTSKPIRIPMRVFYQAGGVWARKSR